MNWHLKLPSGKATCSHMSFAKASSCGHTSGDWGIASPVDIWERRAGIFFGSDSLTTSTTAHAQSLGVLN